MIATLVLEPSKSRSGLAACLFRRADSGYLTAEDVLAFFAEGLSEDERRFLSDDLLEPDDSFCAASCSSFTFRSAMCLALSGFLISSCVGGCH